MAKTVNQDDPSVYHLFYADEQGRPGAELTFFEYPGAIRGRAGAGMVHTIVSRVGSPDALDFWEQRLGDEGVATERAAGALRFADFEGLGHELVVRPDVDEPLAAEHPEIPAEHALQGFDGVRAYTADARAQRRAAREGPVGASPPATARGSCAATRRGGTIAYDPAPDERGRQSAGTVHHVAWGTTRRRAPALARASCEPTGVPNSGVIDRHYFHSIYFREPSGVLFEIADDGPGFTVDVPLEQLGSVRDPAAAARAAPRGDRAPAHAAARPPCGVGRHPLGGADPEDRGDSLGVALDDRGAPQRNAARHDDRPVPSRGVTVLEPGELGWDAARRAFNLAVDQRPALIALPLDERDVIAAVHIAR